MTSQKISDAVMALSTDFGNMSWVRQLTEKDAERRLLLQPDIANCPKDSGSDFDFASSPILADLPNAKHALIAGQGSGMGTPWIRIALVP